MNNILPIEILLTIMQYRRLSSFRTKFLYLKEEKDLINSILEDLIYQNCYNYIFNKYYSYYLYPNTNRRT